MAALAKKVGPWEYIIDPEFKLGRRRTLTPALAPGASVDADKGKNQRFHLLLCGLHLPRAQVPWSRTVQGSAITIAPPEGHRDDVV